MVYIIIITEDDMAKTAKQTYNERREKIENMMKQLEKNLKAQDRNFSKDEKNWGYVGNLSKIESDLGELLRFTK